MFALYILAIILILIILGLLLPVRVILAYTEDFSVAVKFAGITVFSGKKKEQPQKNNQKQEKPKEKPKKTEYLKTSFQKLKQKYGFSGAVKEIFCFLNRCIKHLGWFLKTVKFRKVQLGITVASDDAAKTAIEYGAVCSAVYPVLSLFYSKANIKYKQIDIKSDFNTEKSSFMFSLTVNLQIIFLIITGIKVFKEYKDFSKRNGF